MFRRYSGKGNCSPGVLIVATSVPVLGVSPGAGVTGAAVLGGGSRVVSLGGAGLGTGAGGFFTGLGSGFTGAGFSSGGGVGTASRASRCLGAGAGAATSSTAYAGGVGVDDPTWLTRRPAAAAWTTIVPTMPAAVPGGRPRSVRRFTGTIPPPRPVRRSGCRRSG